MRSNRLKPVLELVKSMYPGPLTFVSRGSLFSASLGKPESPHPLLEECHTVLREITGSTPFLQTEPVQAPRVPGMPSQVNHLSTLALQSTTFGPPWNSHPLPKVLLNPPSPRIKLICFLQLVLEVMLMAPQVPVPSHSSRLLPLSSQHGPQRVSHRNKTQKTVRVDKMLSAKW